MSDMKCPLCKQELRKIHPTYVICDNCRITGDNELWQELIRTRKALEIAVDALKEIDWCATDYAQAQEALNKITAILENKNGNC